MWHEPVKAPVSPPSLSGRNNQPLRVAVLSFRVELPARRRNDGSARCGLTYETVRYWVQKFGGVYAKRLRALQRFTRLRLSAAKQGAQRSYATCRQASRAVGKHGAVLQARHEALNVVVQRSPALHFRMLFKPGFDLFAAA